MSVAVLIVAAGKGLRAGGELPKQYQLLGGEPVLRRTLRAFEEHAEVDRIQVVIGEGADELYARSATGITKALPPVPGGAERQVSVRLGLQALASSEPEIVLIHDAARPFVSAATISRCVAEARKNGAALAALPLSDTLKREGAKGLAEETVPRAGLWRAQTPQAFRFELIRELHERFADRDDMTDDASLAEAAGHGVALVEDETTNLKITRPEDFALAEKLLGAPMETRTGSGFDVHAFEEGDHVTLCGVMVPHTHKLKGHSDADVGMHALTDAIYGALCEGDIGQHFPPSDEQWRGAPSDVFLRHAADLVKKRCGRIVHCDVTIICEAPKVGPHRETMRGVLAEIMGTDLSRVSVKATTTEALGFTGRREGIAAQAIATIKLPSHG
ncbi:bifunctional 2-C-methyl-D-erythritol 4-phosphate cytidylyltransferase/2-C-methyl-D-erythritol 2,4-cyclodiphosphate synthase [Parvularcula maris]|uniref:Bifunctional enzyme IspD/IspF n=1 Tax=Parvularcula maris TaxID=2965077 RepID=A0A9X2L7E3_9PROT|nr:bifunctional 2-C-methyl-D-erythritol 4-phosphate cytidylyltransferase/2-C-methyl-D-erythritol 2,4-cyclodiphosphate synthase [Parvularcula maris]MCQ8184331.1 bifunctional 2-C-methyl-D-erythritol 4-phosphate cytidylyltransferase/2-C-methyl-D-erythritol 2,4-cyclodiphosphate synthase [Parvularcula maris]